MKAVPAPLVAALKRVSLRDHVIGEDGSIAPASDAETGGVGNSHFDDVVDAGEQVLDFVVSPIRRRWRARISGRVRSCLDNSPKAPRTRSPPATAVRC